MKRKKSESRSRAKKGERERHKYTHDTTDIVGKACKWVKLHNVLSRERKESCVVLRETPVWREIPAGGRQVTFLLGFFLGTSVSRLLLSNASHCVSTPAATPPVSLHQRGGSCPSTVQTSLPSLPSLPQQEGTRPSEGKTQAWREFLYQQDETNQKPVIYL